MAAAKGNTYSAKGRRWADAIDRAFENRSKRDQVVALEQLAERLIDLAMEGDLGAIKELGDRLDGKARQQVELAGEGGGPIQTSVIVEFASTTARETGPTQEAEPV